MKKRWIFTFLVTAAVGTALHFVYDLCPVPLVGVFAPVNESVWEHLKLLFWPMLAAGFFLAGESQGSRRFWGAWLLGVLLAPAFLLGVFYALLAGFGVESMAVDIALYYLSLAVGFWAAWHTKDSEAAEKLAGVLVIAAGVYGAALVLFTAAPPDLPIFGSKV